MFPLDFYGRHHQALANSFLSTYSNGNNPNLMVQQYLQQCTPQQMLNNFNTLKESNSNGHLNFANAKKHEEPSPNSVQDARNSLDSKYNIVMTNNSFQNSEKFQKNFCENKQLLNTMCNTAKPNTSSNLHNHVQYDNSDIQNNLYTNKSENPSSNGPLRHGLDVNNIKSENELKENPKTCSTDSNQYTIPAAAAQPNTSNNSANTVENDTKARYSCETCSYVCQSPAILKIHERVHSGEKPFSCTYCDYKSGQKNNVAKHILVHMKKKPYRCQYCDYRCAQKNNLIVHERTHTGVKPFACTFCEYKTVQKPNLVKHMYLHTNEKPFACDMCDYRCVQKTNLTKHKQKHTMEKPFECNECDYRSSQKSNLFKHQLIHVKGEVVKCDQCPHKCIRIEDLEKHKQLKHGATKREISDEVPNLLHNAVDMYNGQTSNSHYSNMISSGNIKCENSSVNY